MSRASRLLLTATALLLSGCVALPYATPPIEYAGGIGVAAPSDQNVRFSIPIRGTIYPAGLFEELYKRTWDLGAGYNLLLPLDGNVFHGPNLSVGYYELFPRESGPRPSMWRVGVAGQPGLSFNGKTGNLGYIVSARVSADYVTWSEGPYSSCNTAEGCAIGFAYGETSIGFFGEASFLQVDPQIWALSFGILFRAPATAGILFAWILN